MKAGSVFEDIPCFVLNTQEIPMRLESIKLAGFRGISKLKLEFPEQVNVLAGVNGSGKSAVLDCTAIMLSRLIGRIRSSSGTGRFFVDSDISNERSETQNRVAIHFQGQSVHWSVTKTRKGRRKQTITKLDVMKKHIIRSGSWKKQNRASSQIAPEDAYGQAVDRILEDIMDVPARPRKIETKLKNLFFAIDEGNTKKTKRLLDSLQGTIGADPALVKADVLIRRREVLKK